MLRASGKSNLFMLFTALVFAVNGLFHAFFHDSPCACDPVNKPLCACQSHTHTSVESDNSQQAHSLNEICPICSGAMSSADIPFYMEFAEMAKISHGYSAPVIPCLSYFHTSYQARAPPAI